MTNGEIKKYFFKGKTDDNRLHVAQCVGSGSSVGAALYRGERKVASARDCMVAGRRKYCLRFPSERLERKWYHKRLIGNHRSSELSTVYQFFKNFSQNEWSLLAQVQFHDHRSGPVHGVIMDERDPSNPTR
jgi:hypothetical protein